MRIRTFIISKDKQYVQSIELKAGRYTVSYSIRTPNTSHKFSFLGRSGTWHEFEMSNLAVGKWITKSEARLTFFLEEDCVSFDLCTSPVSAANPVMIQELMLEEGINAGTAKPHEKDLLESVDDMYNIEHIFKRVATFEEAIIAEAPNSIQQDDFIPEGWEDDPITATPDMPYVIHSFRERIGELWGAFSKPTIFSNYSKDGEKGADGETPAVIEIIGNTVLKNPDKTGGIDSTSLTISRRGNVGTVGWQYLYDGIWRVTTWYNEKVISYSELKTLFQKNVLVLRAYSLNDSNIYTTISITAVWDGDVGATGATGASGESIQFAFLLNNSASTPTKPSGNLPSGSWSGTMGSISSSNKYLWISTRTKAAGSSTWGAWSTAALHAQWAESGLPGQIPIQKEWVQGDRHRNNDEIVDFIYVRGESSSTSYWYQLINKTNSVGVSAGAKPVGGATPSGYKAVSWMNSLALKVLLAEEANLANFIFKEGILMSMKGTTEYTFEELNYGEFIQYQFSTNNSTWTDLPVGTPAYVRYRKSTASTWTTKTIGTGNGQWKLQFATAPEGATWYTSYGTNRFWARAAVGGSNVYGKQFKISNSGGIDFVPYVMLDGESGEISGDKVIASNIRTKIRNVYSNSVSEIQEMISKGYSISLVHPQGSGLIENDYTWYTITLPNDKALSGSTITINFPTTPHKRYRFVPASSNAVIFVNEPIKVLTQLQIVTGMLGTVELKALWNEYLQVLNWVVISDIRFMMYNDGDLGTIRVPPVILPNELMVSGSYYSSSNAITVYNKKINAALSFSVSNNEVTIIVPLPLYRSSTGYNFTHSSQTNKWTARMDVSLDDSARTFVVIPLYLNSAWNFRVIIKNASGTVVKNNFDFRVYANDYIIQSNFMDETL